MSNTYSAGLKHFFKTINMDEQTVFNLKISELSLKYKDYWGMMVAYRKLWARYYNIDLSCLLKEKLFKFTKGNTINIFHDP